MKTALRIIGVDPGFDRLGVAIIDHLPGRQEIVFSDCLITNTADDFPTRLTDLAGRFKKILSQHQPNVLAMETLLFSSNQKTAFKVSELRGVIVYLAHEAGIPIHDYAPPKIKQLVTGYGRADKLQIETMVRGQLKMTDKKKRLDDEYDALAVCLTHAALAPLSTTQG